MVQKKRYYGTFTLGEKISSFLNYEQKRRNFYDERLLINWKDILQDYSAKIKPDKIVFDGVDSDGMTKKILYCSTINRQFANEFLFYKKDILERLNTYFGVEKSRFVDVKLKTL